MDQTICSPHIGALLSFENTVLLCINFQVAFCVTKQALSSCISHNATDSQVDAGEAGLILHLWAKAVCAHCHPSLTCFHFFPPLPSFFLSFILPFLLQLLIFHFSFTTPSSLASVLLSLFSPASLDLCSHPASQSACLVSRINNSGAILQQVQCIAKQPLIQWGQDQAAGTWRLVLCNSVNQDNPSKTQQITDSLMCLGLYSSTLASLEPTGVFTQKNTERAHRSTEQLMFRQQALVAVDIYEPYEIYHSCSLSALKGMLWRMWL